MATINFKIYNKGKQDKTKIYIRLRDSASGVDIEIPTHLTVIKSHWNPNKQEVRKLAETDDYRSQLNEKLSKLNSKVDDAFTNAGDTTITKEWLKDVIAEHQGKPKSSTPDEEIYLASFGKDYAEQSKDRINTKNGKQIDERTVNDYNNTVNKLIAFEAYQKKRVKLTETDLKFHRSFLKYLREVEFLSPNTIGGQIGNIKAFMREAAVLGVPVSNAYLSKQFNAPSSKTLDTYLNESEIQLIYDHQFELEGYLDNARDWLIISVWTGLSVSDLLTLTKGDIIKGFIDLTNKKTDIGVAIPLHRMVRAILAKRNGEFPREISEPKYNNYIKVVVKEVGIDEIIKGAKIMKIGVDANGVNINRKVAGNYHKWELITTHIGRRSFATNHYGKLETLTIMKITGHQTEKQFLDYIKITPREHAQRLAEQWEARYNVTDAA